MTPHDINYVLAWSVGPWEIGLILVAILLLFGGKKLPELARGLGKGLREFKAAARGIKSEADDVKSEINDVAYTVKNSEKHDAPQDVADEK